MRFAPTDEQLEFAAAVRAVLDDTCTPQHLREAWGGAVGAHVGLPDGDGRVRGAWKALVELGALGILVPERNGGLGLTDDHLVLLVKEAGRAGLPEPFAASAGVAAGLLAERVCAGEHAEASLWLARIAEGARVGVGFGGHPRVPAALALDAVLLVDGDSVVLAEADRLELQPMESVDGSRRPCRIELAGEATPVAEGELAARLSARAFDRAATLTAAELLGLSWRMLDMTVDYVGERRQFGAPVGSFQAIKHHLADVGLAVEFAGPLVAVAAHALCSEEPAPVASSMAKLRASQAADAVGRAALQCHGAIGYTVEYDLHLYLKRSWALRRQHGSDDWHRARVRRSLLGR